MDENRNECLGCIRENLFIINDYLRELSESRVDLLFENIEDILIFYGFKKNQIILYINYPANYLHEMNDEKLGDFKDVTNTIVYHLKYKK